MNLKILLKTVLLALTAAAILVAPGFAGEGRHSDGRSSPGGGMNKSATVDSPGESRSRSWAEGPSRGKRFESMKRISTGTMADGGVKLALEPYSFENGIFRLKFYANTHTVNLGDHNLLEKIRLIYGGEEHIPVSMSRMRGHHAGGEIEFDLQEAPDHFRVVINGLPTLNERVYEW